MTPEQQYALLKKKYDLPTFKELDDEFEVGKIELKNDYLYLKDFARAMVNKLGFFYTTLEPAVNPPNPSLHSMIETGNIDDATKENIYQAVQKFSQLYHEGLLVEVYDDTKTAEYIKFIWDQWPEIKEKAEQCFRAVADAWKRQLPEQRDSNYTG